MNKEKLKYRYPGAQPFVKEQQQIFFGRPKDIENLYELLSLEDLVVLFSKSGLGKSSLINAGIIPKILLENEFKPFSIRFGAYTEEQEKNPTDTTSQQILLKRNDSPYLDKLLANDNSFWYHLKNRQAYEANNVNRYILIFDQFEELFTYPEEEILKFKKELKELINKQIPQRFRDALEKQFTDSALKLSDKELELLHKEIEVKILFAIRADRTSLLTKLTDYIPNIQRNSYELEALSTEQAEDAILNPAYLKDECFISPNFDYEDNALDAILQFLTKNYTQKIESFQLQTLCQNIEKTVIEKKLQIVSVTDIGDIESVYKNHYDTLIKNIGTEAEQLAARRLIEEGLIFEEEQRRLSLYEGQIYKNFGVSPNLLKKLVDSHILRAEPSMQGGYTYELCHDSLVASVLDAKKKRKEEEERKRKEENDKKEKKDEEERIKRDADKKLLESEQRARRIAIRFSIGSGILAIIAILAGIFALWQYKEADAERNAAQTATEQAQRSKQKAIAAQKSDSIARVKADSLTLQAMQQKKIAEYEKAKANSSALQALQQKEIAEQGKKMAKESEQKAMHAYDELQKQLEENKKLKEKNKEYEELLKKIQLKKYQSINN